MGIIIVYILTLTLTRQVKAGRKCIYIYSSKFLFIIII